MTKAECIEKEINRLLDLNRGYNVHELSDIVSEICDCSEQYVVRVYNKVFKVLPRHRQTVKVSPVAIIIDRFETRCGACFRLLDDRKVKACPHCESVFTHVTSSCQPIWMRDTAQSWRPDLEWIDFGGLT
jgi:hypothetical protein